MSSGQLTLSTDYSTPVASTATAVTAGYAVCKPLNMDGWAVADTANLAAAGGRFGGIAITSGSAGSPISVVVVGPVDSSIVGALAGSGDWVDVTATGALTRSSGQTSATIGAYMPNGDVEVNRIVQFGAGATGNATEIQGQSVGNTATRGQILTHNGTGLRWRDSDYLSFADYSPAADGVTDDSALLQQFFQDCATSHRIGFIPPGQYGVSARLKLWNDTARGPIKGLTIVGANGRPYGNATESFLVDNITEQTGTGISVTSVTNGGSGNVMTTISAPGIAGTEDIVGLKIVTWGFPTEANNSSGGFTITAIGPGTITYSNAAGVVESGGSFRVQSIMLDIRTYGSIFEGLAFRPGNNRRVSTLVAVTEAPGAGAGVTTAIRFLRCLWRSNLPSADKHRYGTVLMQEIVPEVGNSHRAVNGAGVPHVYSPTQGDLIVFDDCHIMYGTESQISHQNNTGQSIIGAVRGGIIYGGSFGCGGYSVPQGGNYRAGLDFENVAFGAVYDWCIQYGGATRGACRILNCYMEANGRAVSSPGTPAVPQHIEIIGLEFAPQDAVYKHPSREIFNFAHIGPVTILGGGVYQSDNDLHHIAVKDNTYETSITIIGWQMQGLSGWTGRRGQVTATRQGPYDLSGATKTLTVSVDGAGAVTINFALSDFTAAGVTLLSGTLAEVRACEAAKVVAFYLTGGTAWGGHDEHDFRILTLTQGGAGSINVTGGTAAAIFGFAAGAVTGASQHQQSKDTYGYVDTDRLGGGNLSLDLIGCVRTNAALTKQPFPSFVGRKYGTGKKNTSATAKYGEVTHNAGGATFTFTFATAGIEDEIDTTYKVRAVPLVRSAAIAAGGDQLVTITKSTTKVDFAVAADPATGNVTWGVEIIR